jgi:hypothetical protein
MVNGRVGSFWRKGRVFVFKGLRMTPKGKMEIA